MYRRFMERLYLMTNLCWVSRGDVPVTELVEVWQVSTQPTGLTLICVLWLADITLPGGLD